MNFQIGVACFRGLITKLACGPRRLGFPIGGPVLGLAIILASLATSAAALPPASHRHRSFLVPEALSARVDFWIDVFTAYGKNQVVLHHRQFPQAQFLTMDFSQEAQELSPVEYERLRKRRIEGAVQEVYDAMKLLDTGQAPSTAIEQRVFEGMKRVPWGDERYRRTIKEELVRSQTGIREKYAEAVARSGRYIGIMERIFSSDYGLPVELTRLPFIESSFNYQAYSSVGAAGIWQFMRSTGRVYLKVNNLIDERRDAIESTHAAAKYLRSAYARLGSWPLAITSYNHGVAGVLQKVQKLGTTDIAELIEHPSQKAFGFASGNFYPEFLAALDVYENRRGFFPEVVMEPGLKLVSVPLTQQTSTAHVQRQLGVSAEELRSLNYAVSEAVWSGRYKLPAGYVLKIPERSATMVNRLLHAAENVQTEAPAASAIYGGSTYKVRAGDTLKKIAKKFGVSSQSISIQNGLKSDLVRLGQVLTIKPREDQPLKIVPLPARTGTKSTSIKTSKPSSAKTSAAKTYVVKSGDSLWLISKRTGVSVAQLKAANPRASIRIAPGMRLVIPAK